MDQGMLNKYNKYINFLGIIYLSESDPGKICNEEVRSMLANKGDFYKTRLS